MRFYLVLLEGASKVQNFSFTFIAFFKSVDQQYSVRVVSPRALASRLRSYLYSCVWWNSIQRITVAREKKDRLNLLASNAISKKRNFKVRDVYFEAGPKFKQRLQQLKIIFVPDHDSDLPMKLDRRNRSIIRQIIFFGNIDKLKIRKKIETPMAGLAFSWCRNLRSTENGVQVRTFKLQVWATVTGLESWITTIYQYTQRHWSLATNFIVQQFNEYMDTRAKQ